MGKLARATEDSPVNQLAFIVFLKTVCQALQQEPTGKDQEICKRCCQTDTFRALRLVLTRTM